MTTLRFPKARLEARKILQRFGLECERPVSVENIAFALNARVVQGELTGALASLARAGDRAQIRVSDRHHRERDVRFSIAHELGHFVLGHESSLDIVSAGNIRRHFRCDAHEREANTFAGELLLPGPAVRGYAALHFADFGEVRALAHTFGAPTVATAIRLVELSTEACALALVQNGRVRWVVHSAAFWPRIRVGDCLDGSHAVFEQNVARSRPGLVESLIWFQIR